MTKLLGLGEVSVKTQPKSVKDLVANAANDYLLCFDNCGVIDNRLSDALCSVATGGTVADRKLYTNSEITEVRLHQPMILTSIEFAKQYDLTTRSIFLKADKPAINYASDTDIFRKLDSILSEAQSWLLETSAKAMNALGLVDPVLEHRASDFCQWLAAFEVAVGIEDQSLQTHVQDVQQDATKQQALDHDDVLAAIVTTINEHGKFEGNPTQVYKALTAFTENLGRLPKQWPGNASAMSNKLNRISGQLAKQGVEVISGGSRDTNGRKLVVQPIEVAQRNHVEVETIADAEASSFHDGESWHPAPTMWEKNNAETLNEETDLNPFDDDLEEEIDQEEADRLTCEMLG